MQWPPCDGNESQNVKALELRVTVSIPRCAFSQTVSLVGFQSMDAVSAATAALAQQCGALRCQHELHWIQEEDDHMMRPSEAENSNCPLVAIWNSVLQKTAGSCRAVQLWQDSLQSTQDEFHILQERYKRNVESMAKMRSTYLREILWLKEQLPSWHLPFSKNSSESLIPSQASSLRLLNVVDYIVPADLSMSWEQAAEAIKERMEKEWEEKAKDWQEQLKMMRNQLLERTTQLSHQAEFYDRLWAARTRSTDDRELETNSEPLRKAKFSRKKSRLGQQEQVARSGTWSANEEPVRMARAKLSTPLRLRNFFWRRSGSGEALNETHRNEAERRHCRHTVSAPNENTGSELQVAQLADIGDGLQGSKRRQFPSLSALQRAALQAANARHYAADGNSSGCVTVSATPAATSMGASESDGFHTVVVSANSA